MEEETNINNSNNNTDNIVDKLENIKKYINPQLIVNKNIK